MVITPFDNKPPSGGGNRAQRNPAEKERFVLAHLSDPHMAWAGPVKKRDLLNKRLAGYLKWRFFRNTEHRREILTILKEDLDNTRPDHIVITGDLTHLGLPAEFKKARTWLQSLGTPSQVTVVPGNHDAYVRSDWDRTFACWLDYMRSDPPCRNGGRVRGLDDLFPTLRVRGRIALIGLCSAHPSAPHLAIGTVGGPQLRKLETVLKQTGDRGLFRIVAIHHPPLSGIVSRRKRLTDAHALRGVVARCGAELMLHGHAHRMALNTLDTRSGRTPVAGAPSASSSSSDHQRRARYHVFTLTASENACNVHMGRRVYSPDARCFIPEKGTVSPVTGPLALYRCIVGKHGTRIG
ncbi:Ser/Thr phosphatase family protein [delta proteobacterium NaphS2]|nr:Ser/Thr phosphatase family protein [delta proteobacterium NaphS2]